MAFARVDDPKLAPTRLEDVLEASLATMSQQDNIQVSKHLATDLRPMMADSEQLQRVFLNLAINAQESMPNGGELTITATNVNNHVEISLSDTGVGISDENIEKIFEPLFTTKIQGTGLGLANCQEIIMRHGGTISASRNPEPACGSTFLVTLPAADGEPS